MLKAKPKLESRNWKIQYDWQAAILKVTSLTHDHKQYAYEIWNWNSKANLSYAPETMPPTESRYQTIQYGCLVDILKVTLLKINRLFPIHTSGVPVKFWLDIQRQSKVRVWKPKNPIWLPGGQFESDIAENFSYTSETMSSTDGWMDRLTDGQGESSIPLPRPTSSGSGEFSGRLSEKFCLNNWEGRPRI